MASRGLLIPSSYLPYILNTAAAISVIPIAAGLTGILSPHRGIDMLFEGQKNVENKLTKGLFQMYSVRQLTIGLSSLAMWYTGSSEALGLSMLGGCLVAATDGMVSKDVTGHHILGHWVAFPISLFMGSALLHWI